MKYIAVKGYTNSVTKHKFSIGTVVNKSDIDAGLLTLLLQEGVLIEGDTLPIKATQPKRKANRTRRSK